MKILVVDNDEGLRDYLAMIIETGFECDLMEAGTAAEAITVLDENKDTRLIISEVDLPDGGAQAIFEHVKPRKTPPPFICLTNKPKDDPTVVAITQSSEFNGHSPKPFKDADLFPLVEHALTAPFELEAPEPASAPTNAPSASTQEQAPAGSSGSDDWSYGANNTKKKQEEVEADWSYGKQPKKAQATGEADWDISGKKKPQAEGEADWDIGGKKKPQAEGEADWDISGKKKPQAEGEADWDIGGKKGGQADQEADWDTANKKPSAGEQDADWDTANKKPGAGEQDADWDTKNKKPGAGEQDADWDTKNKKPLKYHDPSKVRKKTDDEEEVEGDRFVGVKIKRFLNFNSLPSCVFVRLSPRKFVKIIEKNDLYEREVVQKYLKRNIKKLYILREEYENFNRAFSNLIMASLSNKKLTQNQRAVGELVAYTHILEQARKVGISEFVAEQAKQTIENSIAQMKNDSKLAGLLDSIMRGEDFISEHSLFLTYICQNICSKTSWGSEATYQKLSMAALLHDVALENPEFAKIESKDSELFKSLSKEDKEKVLSHPSDSAAMATAGSPLYADIENIIVQHHEQPDGTGFPRGLSPLRISPLSAIFIIAQEYMHAVIHPDVTKEDIKAAVARIKEKYPRGNFKKPLQGFLKAFDK